MAKKTSTNKRGKTVKIDLAELEELYAMHCTDDEVASFFKCTRKTLSTRKRNPEVKEAIERGQLRGKVSLRRLMWRKAQGMEGELLINPETNKVHIDEKGRVMWKIVPTAPDTTMQIWLSKNVLGYVDKVEHTGKDGGPVEVIHDAKGKLLSAINRLAPVGTESESGGSPQSTGS